jgi:gamma-glutamyltranspeptidase / glutathione hydrolase
MLSDARADCLFSLRDGGFSRGGGRGWRNEGGVGTEDRMDRSKGAVACGHPVTLEAATAVLRAGGNAFDAAVAAFWAACVAEPLLASPGGGGFLLARPVDAAARVYDFFAQTPGRRLPDRAVDFREVLVDFGPARQAFHIGLGSAAVPGVVAGIFRCHRELGRVPMEELVQPAVAAARSGVPVSRLQAHVAHILFPILNDGEGTRAAFLPGGRPPSVGDLHVQEDLAGFMEDLVAEGEDLFYRGEVARWVDRACREGGGHLRREDLEKYQVLVQPPLDLSFGGGRVRTNPPPASGGVLIGFGLRLLDGRMPHPDHPAGWFGPHAAGVTAAILAAMQEGRLEAGLAEGVDWEKARFLLSDATMARHLSRLARHPRAREGTTHVSVMDEDGNAASLSLTNGEGCGWTVPGTGFMLNNMLGESDLHPGGFARWPPDTRLTSMMAPTVMEGPGRGDVLVLGSGGSNRIRSAILQVLMRVAALDQPLGEAVSQPRLHVEGGRLEIEGGFPPEVVQELVRRWPEHRLWPELNLFFGGVHAVRSRAGMLVGAGDPRREGVAHVL